MNNIAVKTLLKDIWFNFPTHITPPVVVVFLLGIFWRRGTATAATVTLAACIPLGVLGWILNEIISVYQIQFLYACGVMTIVSLLFFICVSLVTEKPSHEQVSSLTWTYDFWQFESRQLKKVPWYRDYRIQSAVLLAVALSIVFLWW